MWWVIKQLHLCASARLNLLAHFTQPLVREFAQPCFRVSAPPSLVVTRVRLHLWPLRHGLSDQQQMDVALFSKGRERTFKPENHHSDTKFGFAGPIRKITAADKNSNIVCAILQLSPVSRCFVLCVASAHGRRAAAQLKSSANNQGST